MKIIYPMTLKAGSLPQVKNHMLFEIWVSKLREHRLFRQHEISFGTKETPKLTDVATPVNDFTPITSPVSPSTSLQCEIKKKKNSSVNLG